MPCSSGHRLHFKRLQTYSWCRTGTRCQQLQFKPRRFLGLGRRSRSEVTAVCSKDTRGVLAALAVYLGS